MQSSTSNFQVSISSGVPIYRQLMDQVRALVASGRLAEGDLLPSVRQLGQDLQINQMTVSKAYSLLERDGVVERVRGHGMRINQRLPKGTVKERQDELRSLLEQVAAQAYQLALTREQVLAALDPLLKERGNE
ncbi:GntR family transcriptional regulator [Schlesneria paludicola]|uniref:GntR family transcriptional regulator n=1 Tax=Schlesneria paludicola TaxID=360056 RepID=UPI00029A9BD3|nr:GntR family transcriptional regulator [Schlesneria paludicola]